MSKGKNRKNRPLPELQDGAPTTSTGADTPSTPRGSASRLPSLRPKRDLTLGGPPPSRNSKKTFAPTIPVRRKKVEAAVPPSPDEATQQREKGRERRERGRGRGRRGRDIVTSASVFSMGPAERLMQKRESMGETLGRFSRSEKSASVKAKNEGTDSNKYHPRFSDDEKEEEEEEERGGVEVMGGQLFPDSRLPPVQLPLDYSCHAGHKTVAAKNKIIKQEMGGDATASPAPVKLVKPAAASQSQSETMTAAKLFTPSEGSKGQFLFFHLPDCLPLEGGARDEVAMDTSTAPPIQPTANSSASAANEKREEESLSGFRGLPDGLIGKIRVHKSGKVKLVLGDTTLDVAMGTPTGFLQELVSVRAEGEEQRGPCMTVLGQLAHRLICTPDFEALLASKRLSSTGNGYDSPSPDHEQPR